MAGGILPVTRVMCGMVRFNGHCFVWFNHVEVSLQVLLAGVRRKELLFPDTVWFSGWLTMPRGRCLALSWGSVAMPLLNGWGVGAGDGLP